jgi:hypothetical protein
MTIRGDLRDQVRRRANFTCEYCGVTEADSGGELTVDHFQPSANYGTDEFANLLYCCFRCNLYKSDYWPAQGTDPALWNPRQSARESHLLLLANGMLHPITAAGEFTLRRLRLNRQPLVAYRVRRWSLNEAQRLMGRCRDLLSLVEQLHQQQARLLEEQHALLKEQRAWLELQKGGSIQ